jgi:hypothetical protein
VARPPGAEPPDLVYFADAAVARIARWDEAVMEALAGRPGVWFRPRPQAD